MTLWVRLEDISAFGTVSLLSRCAKDARDESENELKNSTLPSGNSSIFGLSGGGTGWKADGASEARLGEGAPPAGTGDRLFSSADEERFGRNRPRLPRPSPFPPGFWKLLLFEVYLSV